MFRLHKEGYRIIVISCILAIVVGILLMYLPNPYRTILILALGIFLVLIIRFFRYPDRKLSNPDPKKVLAPADGKVVVIEEVFEEEFLKARCIQISIFMSPLNVHVNWSPVAGRVIKKEHYEGKYLVAWNPKSSTENERTSLVIEDGHRKILVRQIAGAVARRIINYIQPGDVLKPGDEMGFIRFGSRVDVLVPLDTDIKATVGQKVKGNESLLAMLR